MKYNQRKVWPTRRIHLFQGKDELSICGCALRVAGEPINEFDWKYGNKAYHPADDLNFCQSCRRVAMKAHGQKYLPLTEKYDHLRKAYERATK